mmetsp:Transcript_28408/g.68391  ORF Transcript_28408/g.68391 Transcript_28408/m.68391 type:complete len:134 (+) Transcript_28408:169-570(+)
MATRTISTLLARKIITLPQLSPTHTSARLVERLVQSGSQVVEYQPIMTVQCSSDVIADPADRVTPEHQPMMLLECMEEGSIRWARDATTNRSEWIKVGTILGEIVDEDEDDADVDDWAWQAYLHDNNKGEGQG